MCGSGHCGLCLITADFTVCRSAQKAAELVWMLSAAKLQSSDDAHCYSVVVADMLSSTGSGILAQVFDIGHPVPHECYAV